MKRIRNWLIYGLWAFGGVAFGAAEREVYSSPHYVAGGAENHLLRTERPVVSTVREKVFAGATLAEIESATFGGYLFGINQAGDALSYFTHPYRDANGVLQFLVVCVQKRDYRSISDCHIKSVAVKLTQGDDGVYAQLVRADGTSPYLTTTDESLVATRDFVSVANDGTISFQNYTGLLSYSMRSLFALQFVSPTNPVLVFANPAGGSTLTVDDIKDYSFEGVMVGLSVNYHFSSFPMQNPVVILGPDGKATKIRLELQAVDDKYLKCAVVELTNGTGGVWAQTVKAGYRNLSTAGVALGVPFLTADGSWAFSDIAANTPCESILASGYGAAGLVARRNRALLLDATQTWTELTNGVEEVQGSTNAVQVKVVADNPTLTFDVPVIASELKFLSSGGWGMSFEPGEGLEGGLRVGALAFDVAASVFKKTGTETLTLATEQGVTVSGGGTLEVVQGLMNWTRPEGSVSTAQFTGDSAVLQIDPDGIFETEGSVRFRQIVNNGRVNLQTLGRDLTFAGAYSGTGRVYKEGAGFTAYVNLSSLSTSAIYVQSGRLALNERSSNNTSYHFVTPQMPDANIKITVAPGAQYDVNGKNDFNASVQIAGSLEGGTDFDRGAFCNRGGVVGGSAAQTVQLILSADAQVGGLADFGLLAPAYGATQLELNGHTMDLYTKGNFWLANTSVVGPGTLSVRGGTLNIWHDATRGEDWTLETQPSGQVAFNASLSCSNLVWRGVASGTGTVTAWGVYAPYGGTLPQVELAGPGAGLDLSSQTTAFDLDAARVTFAPDTRMRIVVGSRLMRDGERLLAWTSLPTQVTAWNFASASRRFRLEARADGLYVRATQCVLYVF